MEIDHENPSELHFGEAVPKMSNGTYFLSAIHWFIPVHERICSTYSQTQILKGCRFYNKGTNIFLQHNSLLKCLLLCLTKRKTILKWADHFESCFSCSIAISKALFLKVSVCLLPKVLCSCFGAHPRSSEHAHAY